MRSSPLMSAGAHPGGETTAVSPSSKSYKQNEWNQSEVELWRLCHFSEFRALLVAQTYFRYADPILCDRGEVARGPRWPPLLLVQQSAASSPYPMQSSPQNVSRVTAKSWFPDELPASIHLPVLVSKALNETVSVEHTFDGLDVWVVPRFLPSASFHCLLGGPFLIGAPVLILFFFS